MKSEEILSERANLIIELIDKMDLIFPNTKGENKTTILKVCITDAYRQGLKDGFDKRCTTLKR